MRTYRNLNVWQKSVELSQLAYAYTKDWESVEKYGMVSQIRRSAVSVAANIAEGCGRETNKDLSHFLDMSAGSVCELDTLLVISQATLVARPDLKEIADKMFPLIEEIRKMLYGLKDSCSRFS